MLTQGIKRWLQSLFAWWPWRRAEEMDYAHPTGPLNRGTPSEMLFRTAIDGPHTQSAQQNIITISIEQFEDEEIVEWPPFENRERSAPLMPPITSTPPVSPVPAEEDEEILPFSELYEQQQALTDSKQEKMPEASEAQSSLAQREPMEPTPQQRLEFLRYLVQRGIVSDDIP